MMNAILQPGRVRFDRVWCFSVGLVFLGLVLIGIAGCGGQATDYSQLEFGTVKGRVLLDGQPVSEAVVTFTPTAGNASSGITDVDGNYALTYNSEKEGAIVGNHSIRISTARTVSAEAEDGSAMPPTPEVIPVKYNQQTELTREVVSGENSIDFELEPGEVIQPETGAGGDL